MINVRDAMRSAAFANKDRPAIISDGRTLSFGEAWTRGLRFANAMLQLGVKPGDRIAVLEDNCIESSDFFLGTAAANLVRVPLYKRNSSASHAKMVGQTGCRAIVVAAKHQDEIAGIKALCPDLDHIVVRDDDYEQWLASFSDEDPDPAIAMDDYYIIRHSGGTTGSPKGMAFTHKSWMFTERDWTYRLPPIELGDACTHVAPISHGSGYLFVPIWLSGGYNILEAKFEPERLLTLLSEHGGYAFAVPTIISDIVAYSQNHAVPDLSKLKALAIAGAPMREKTSRDAYEIFGARMNQFFGQTEAVPATWMTAREWFADIPGSNPMRSVGRIMPFAQVEIRDEDNRPVPRGEEGEIAIKVDGQMEGIWGEPEMTAQRLVDGWVLSGDVGYIDANNYLYLVDRKDDMIISGGFNIWPAELEIAIASHPAVREVAVVAAPHDRWGETPVAVVVLHDGQSVTEEELIGLCATRLGGYKKPTKVYLQQEPLPRTPVGKVPRKQIRERFWEAAEDRIGGA
ncbi:class I adenylate-forming enzyme family protein [Sphingobium aquiterrae]|uniref:class I adenylate-forming enzyme family protein n=1 Tax=Sphingobium aquiterrae TaxID=2038656 RepID=UPI003019A660